MKPARRGRAPGRPSFYGAVWDLVRRVPRGKVVTYGQVATWLGSPRAARAVGYAMFSVQDADVPWHRVINHQGRISIGGALHRPELQRRLLEEEGVELDAEERIDLSRYGWDGGGPGWSRELHRRPAQCHPTTMTVGGQAAARLLHERACSVRRASLTSFRGHLETVIQALAG